MAVLPVIKNIDEIATTPLRRDALDILEAGYEAVLTDRVIRAEVEVKGGDICIKDKSICLSDYERIFFIGIGKCAVDASLVFEELLGDRITDGVIIDVKSGVFKKMRSFIGSHPFPSEANISATKEVVSMLHDVTARDLVLVVVSGGGSSLLQLPHKLSSGSIQSITEALWKEGANIQEVNTVRKHISDIQGGQLAKLAFPATVVSFIFSDVPGNDIGIIASGPTVRDRTTVEDAERILAQYNILTLCKLPDCELSETPKEEMYFTNVMNILLVTNDVALGAMRQRAADKGYNAIIKETAMTGYAAEVGKMFATVPMPPKTCYIYGGETTVKIGGDGQGGRAQEIALSASMDIPPERVVVAAASDGWDNTEAAGAITDFQVLREATAKGLSPDEYLAKNDSYNFWKEVGGAIMTGRTGINVSDLHLVITQ